MDRSKNPSNCARNLGVDMNKVNECVQGNKGVQLQLKAEKETTPIIQRSSFVPTVNFFVVVFLSSYMFGHFSFILI